MRQSVQPRPLWVLLGCALRATTFPGDLPRMPSELGDLLIGSPALVHSAEEKSSAEC